MGVLDFINTPQFQGLLTQQPVTPTRPQGIAGWLAGMRGPGNTVERLGLFGAQLQDIEDGGDRAAMIAQNRASTAEAARKAEALAKLQQFLNPPANPSAGSSESRGPNAATSSQGLPTLRQAAPALLAATQAGIPVSDYISLLDKATPSVQVANGVAYDPQATAPGSRIGTNLTNVNGFLTDTQDPNNANLYRPDLEAGQRPVYDQNGRIVGVENIPGSVQAVAQREGAITGARQGAEAPYRFLTTTDAQGRPVQTAISNIAGGSVVGANPNEVASASRLTADQDARLIGLRNNVQAGRSQLQTIGQLRAILPDIIAGPGADIRLQGARLLAASGNAEARRRVAATETFQNQARYIVKDLLPSFGANPTEGERKYASEMAGADINITPQAIEEGYRLLEQRIRRQEAQLAEAEQQAQSRAGGGQSVGVTREAAIAEARRRGLIP